MIETHSCRVKGCGESIPHGRLMCLRHWRMLPAPLQREVNASYTALRSVRRGSVSAMYAEYVRTLRAYLAAAREAVRCVDGLESDAVEKTMEES